MTVVEALSSYKGRMSRSEYWIKGMLPLILTFGLFGGLLGLAYGLLNRQIGYQLSSYFRIQQILGWLLALILTLLWLQLPLITKRLHDRNHSLWYWLIAFIPIIGGIVVAIELGFFKGTTGDNRFGPDPLHVQGPNTKNCSSVDNTNNKGPAILALVNATLLFCVVFVLILVIPTARIVYRNFGESMPGIVMLILNCSSFLRKPVLAGMLFGFALWASLRLYRLFRASQHNYLWLMFFTMLFIHMLLAISYIPAIIMYGKL